VPELLFSNHAAQPSENRGNSAAVRDCPQNILVSHLDLPFLRVRIDNMSYPIKTIQHHEQALRDMDDVDMSDPENLLAVRYHLTASCALQLGNANDIDGPAYEFRRGKRVIVRPVQDELIKFNGQHGPDFKCKPLEPIE
jgi:hypothetical protein